MGVTIDRCITTSYMYEKLVMEPKSTLIINTWSILKIMDEIVYYLCPLLLYYCSHTD